MMPALRRDEVVSHLDRLQHGRPTGPRAGARRLIYRISDIADRVLGLHDPLTPPRLLRRRAGPLADVGSYRRVGEESFGYLRQFCALQPYHRVMDIGCGCGRLAVPLTRYLDTRGSYDGFDVAHDAIEWCRQAIAARHENFRFEWADLRNDGYNPLGGRSAGEYRFPYPNDRFDVAIAISVFTHMLPDDTTHYFSEIARALKPGGRLFATFLLLNDEVKRLIAAGKSTIALREDRSHYRILDPVRPTDAVGYDEEWLRAQLGSHGLDVACPTSYGSWCGRSSYLSYQDVVIVTRK